MKSFSSVLPGSATALIVFLVLAVFSAPALAAPRFPRPMSGEEALAALGKELPAVAAEHQMSAEEFRRVLRQDRSARLDRNARLFYVEEIDPQLEAGATAAGEPMLEPLAPLDQTFQLHSRPGASRILYLDFDGHVMSGNAWTASYNGGSNIVCPAWDIDGNPSVFNDTERTRIQQVWLRVSEDFAPFDVNVTTEYPGEAALARSSTADLNYGMRVLISPIASYFGNYGGIAYVNVFSRVGDYYQPALVFPEKLGNGEKNIAEAASHEAGHTFGLQHDGTTNGVTYYSGHGSGETGWAPIMGTGYSRNLTQWSKGEYPAANNQQDDLAQIATHTPYVLDDHGDAAATATVLPIGATLNISGLIGRTLDVDVFRFTAGAGAASFTILPFERGANLDLQAELFDAHGNLLSQSNPLDFLNASFATTLTGGTYYLVVNGLGKGDLNTGYSDYGSLGQYSISASVVNPSGDVPPIAAASASPTMGPAPLNVQFSSAQSSDPDGVIVAYLWDFGDGTTATDPNPTHTFTLAGNHEVTLVVLDDSGLTDATTLTISALAPNVPPVAIASAAPTTGYAPLPVIFSGANSYDTDGSIVSHQWNFGNGATGSGATVSHTYQSAGNYAVTLTVTDNRGASSTGTIGVQVAQDPARFMRVSAISLTAVAVKGGNQVHGTVRIVNPQNQPVAGAIVTGQFSGAVAGTASATTDANGNAVLTSGKFKSGVVTLSVTGVTRSGDVYDAGANTLSSQSITVGSTTSNPPKVKR